MWRINCVIYKEKSLNLKTIRTNEPHMTSPSTKPEYPKLPENTAIPGQKKCSKNLEKDKSSIMSNKNIISFQRYRNLSSTKNKKPLDEKYLFGTSPQTTQKTIMAYHNTLKSYARWASPTSKAIKQL